MGDVGDKVDMPDKYFVNTSRVVMATNDHSIQNPIYPESGKLNIPKNNREMCTHRSPEPT